MTEARCENWELGRDLTENQRQEWAEISDGLEHAARVAWRWLVDDDGPWERDMTLRMVEGLSRMAKELRDYLVEHQPAPARQDGGK